MAKNLVFITTTWGFENGGINSFNVDLCTNLTKTAAPESYKVFIIVFKATLAKPKEIELIKISSSISDPKRILFDDMPRSQQNLIIEMLRNKENVVIGHDRISGQFAIDLTKALI